MAERGTENRNLEAEQEAGNGNLKDRKEEVKEKVERKSVQKER